MEEQSKKKSHQINISNGGGGAITGLLVLGGALAITGLMAVAAFATNKNKKKGLGLGSQVPQESDHSGSKTEDEDEEAEATQGQGLRSLLHEDSTTTDANEGCATYTTPEISMYQINSTDLLSTQTLILEEKPGLKSSNEESPICFHQEIVFSDDSHPGSAVSLNDNGVEEDVDKTESEEGLYFIEMIGAQNENATPEAETRDDTDDDEEFDDSVRSSEATGRTSLDSNEEPIWPAELIEEPQKEFKEKIVNLQSPQDQEELEKAVATPETNDSESDTNLSTEVDTDSSKSDSSDCVGNYDYRDMTRETNLYAVLNDHDQPSVKVSHPLNLRIWIASLLLLALLLFLLLVFTNRTPLSSYFLHATSLVVP